MASAMDLRRLALALPGVVEYPHFDRRAFKSRVTFVTLAPAEETANFKFTPGAQALKCAIAPSVFEPIANAWGARGWTVARLAEMSEAELAAALDLAWEGARPKPKRKSKRAKSQPSR